MPFFMRALVALSLLSTTLAFNAGSALLSSSQRAAHEYPVRLIYQYPEGTWIENVAVRENGELLLTQFTLGRLDVLNPLVNKPEPETVYKFPNYTSVLGIAEIESDVFATIVGNYDFTSNEGVQGSWGIWKANFTAQGGRNASIAKIASIPSGKTLDGMTSIPSAQQKPNNILVSDVKTGKVWFVNTETGSKKVALDNSYTALAAAPYFGQAGVNGVHVRHQHLYFTNSGKGIFARMALGSDGIPVGSTEVLTHILNATTQYYDDFTFKGNDVYLVTGSGNSIEKFGLDGTRKGRIIAGNLNSTEIAEPTSCVFGRTPKDSHVLYVVTGGGLIAPINGNETVGAQVIAIDTRLWDTYAV